MSRLVRARPSKLVTLAVLALLVPAMAGSAHAGSQVTDPGAPAVVAAGTPLTPPVAAQQANGVPGSGIHALGFVRNPAAPQIAANSLVPLLALPASVDLSQYDPPVGDQKGDESCTSWATGYYMRGWYARRDGYYPAGGSDGAGSYAPMYLYSQVTGGRNVGTSFADNLNILEQQGIDTRADYTQGDYDYVDLPTAAEMSNAAHVKIASYRDVGGSNLQDWIETAMFGGNPVAVGIPIYPEFDGATAADPLVGLPKPGEHSRGGHSVFATKYDANGLWIENSWGTSYGLNGYSELSWSFVNRYVGEAVSLSPELPTAVVPNVIGQLPAPASSTLRAAGFRVFLGSVPDPTCNHFGIIMREVPSAGSVLPYGTTVTISVGGRPRTPCP